MTRLPNGIDVEGPVQAEVFVVWLNGNRPELTGPCGAATRDQVLGMAVDAGDTTTHRAKPGAR